MEDFGARAEKILRERVLLESEIKKLGGKNPMVTLEAYSKVRDLVLGFRELEEKGKEMENADIAVRYKFSHKAKKAGKEFWRVVREINSSHEKGALEEGDARQFGKVLEKLKGNKPKEAEAELSKFRRLESLEKEMRRSWDNSRLLSGEIESRIHGLEKELSETGPTTITPEIEKSAGEYSKALLELESYSAWRKAQVSKFQKMPVHRLVRACSTSGLYGLGFPKPRDEFSFEELGEFLEKGKLDADSAEALRLSDLRHNELKKFVSDQHLYRRLSSENYDWLASVAGLERTDFLLFDFGSDEKKKAIISAVEASGEKGPLDAARKLSEITRADYEEMKRAHSRIDEAKPAPKESGHSDPEKLRLEKTALQEIKSRLQFSRGT